MLMDHLTLFRESFKIRTAFDNRPIGPGTRPSSSHFHYIAVSAVLSSQGMGGRARFAGVAQLVEREPVQLRPVDPGSTPGPRAMKTSKRIKNYHRKHGLADESLRQFVRAHMGDPDDDDELSREIVIAASAWAKMKGVRQ